MGKLVLFHADGTAQEVKLDRQRVTIGRRPDNDLCLPQPAVSGGHAAIVTILGDSFLEDLGSTNGTRVNGKPVTKHFLRDRDEIDVGREILVYLADDLAVLEAPPRRVERPAAANGRAASPDEPRRPSPPAVHRDKRRSDGLVSISGRDVEAVQQVVAAEIEGYAAERSAAAPGLEVGTPPPAPLVRPQEPPLAIRVLSGTSAGRVLSLSGGETVVGRAGVQVAALRRTGEEVRVVPIEGAAPPTVNGTPVPPGGQCLAVGDILEIAGATLGLVLPSEVAS